MTNSNNLQDLIARTPLTKNFKSIIPDIEKQFDTIGKIESYFPINEGYEDANILLVSRFGKFVMKIFLTERSDETIADYIKVILESTRVGIHTTTLVEGGTNYLGELDNAKFIITKFFEGENFQKITPTTKDMLVGVDYLAKLNTLSFPIHDTYDSWGNKNLAKEYKEIKHKLSPSQLNQLNPRLREFNLLDFSQLSQSVIHGDMQRKHLLKNSMGEYCMLDFGCMAYGPKVIDLSTYLAWFCLGADTWGDKDKIYRLMVGEYCKTHELSDYELTSIKPLIRASYAAYFQKTAGLIYDGDHSAETLDWHQKSKTMLELSSGWT